MVYQWEMVIGWIVIWVFWKELVLLQAGDNGGGAHGEWILNSGGKSIWDGKEVLLYDAMWDNVV